MNNLATNIRITVTLALLMTVVLSCKKSFLEIAPKGKLIAQKVSDYNLLLSNLDLVNISANAQVPMGDEVVAVEPYFSGAELKTQRLFRWDDVVYEPDENASETAVPLQNIYTFNKIINEVPNATDGTEQQKLSIKAEAMASRAWTYFLLINYFGKPYNTTTSATDLGFPIVKDADVTAIKFTRATVQEVYDFILADLLAAIPNLPEKTTHRLRMSKPAAEGLLGKVYVFMGKFNEAIPHFDAALNGIKNSAIPVQLYDYNVTFATGGAFLPIDLFGPTYPTVPNNLENVFGKQAFNNWSFTNNELVVDKKTADLYTADDLRLNFYSSEAFFGPAYPSGLLRKIGPGSIQFGVVVPDLYLLRAECRARGNDLHGATADVEALRSKRMPAGSFAVPTAIAAQKMPLLNYIMDERLREFALSGYRWFDMRRLSVDPLFGTKTFTHTLYSATGSKTTFTFRPERFVLRFPEKVINENPGMQNNP